MVYLLKHNFVMFKGMTDLKNNIDIQNTVLLLENIIPIEV